MARATYPPVEDVAAFHLLYSANDGVQPVECMNTLYVHWDRIGTWSPSDLSDMADIIGDSWNTNVAAFCQPEYILHTITAKNLTDPANPTFEFAQGPYAGRHNVDPLPFTVCAVIQYLTDGTHPARAYIRHGGLTEDQCDGNHLGTATQGDLANVWDILRQDIAAGITDVQQVAVSPYEPGGVAPNIYRDDGLFNDIATVACRRRVGRSVSRLV